MLKLLEENLEAIREIIKNQENNNNYFNNREKDNDFVKDLVILIPTHNRHSYLKRSMRYYLSFNIKTVFIDSTEDPIDLDFNEYENISYLHIKKDFPNKIYKVLNNLDEKYVVISPDDDFVIYDTLMTGINYLKNNDDYKAYLGRYLGYYRNSQVVDFMKIYKWMPKGEILYSNPGFENIDNFFEKYYIILWGLFDRELLLNAYDILKDINLKNHNFYEIVLGILILFNTNLKIDDEIWGVREIDKNSWGSKHKKIDKLDNLVEKKDFLKMKRILDEQLVSGITDYALNKYLMSSKKSLVTKAKDYIYKIYGYFR